MHHDTLLVAIDGNETVAQLKSKIEVGLGIPVAMQDIAFNGRFMCDKEILADRDVKHGSTLSMYVGSHGSSEIYVRGFQGEFYTLKVDIQDTVDSLKEKIWVRTGVDPDKQRLIYGGKQLAEGRTLAEYGFEEYSTIGLVSRLCGD